MCCQIRAMSQTNRLNIYFGDNEAIESMVSTREGGKMLLFSLVLLLFKFTAPSNLYHSIRGLKITSNISVSADQLGQNSTLPNRKWLT